VQGEREGEPTDAAADDRDVQNPLRPQRLAGPGAYSFFRARTALAASAAESRAT
jgi:hypothetical protein